MKVREGHVSNSSSSSFMLVTTKENYERALSKADDFTKYLVGKLFSEGKLGGIEVMTLTGTQYDGYGYEGLCSDFPLNLKDVKIRGCPHQERECDFCPECGKPMWKTKKAKPPSEDAAFREFARELREGDCLSESWDC